MSPRSKCRIDCMSTFRLSSTSALQEAADLLGGSTKLVQCVCRQWMKKPMSQSRRSDMGLKCNQQMRFEALSPLLAHSEARGQLAELWSGESQDPYKVVHLRLLMSSLLDTPGCM